MVATNLWRTSIYRDQFGSSGYGYYGKNTSKIRKLRGWRLCSSESSVSNQLIYPIPSMGLVTGIFTYIWLIFMVNVGKYTIHGSYGYAYFMFSLLSDSGVGQKIFSSWQFCEKSDLFWGGDGEFRWPELNGESGPPNFGIKRSRIWITRKMNLGAGAMGSLWSWNYECVFSETCWEDLTCLGRQFLECNEKTCKDKIWIIYWCRLRWTSKSCMWYLFSDILFLDACILCWTDTDCNWLALLVFQLWEDPWFEQLHYPLPNRILSWFK